MKKTVSIILALALAAIAAPTVVRADEGMWLPSLISSRIADMQAKGFRLSAEDIYSVNQASLKDAVLMFGGGCSGEMVSGQGLVLTNHHCGYYHIGRHSGVGHDYLRDGFWALMREDELPCPGLTVSFLERMDDVTALILKDVSDDTPEAQRDSMVKARSKALAEEAVGGRNGLRASVEPLWYGNQYFIFVYKTYRDVRLVGAPPSSIGKFGGDTDNWMWPRHTGDFSIFRVYAGADNEPADYSPDNKPFKPKKFFEINAKGLNEGDFTFIYGNPGSTREHITGEAVRWIGEVSDPAKIEIRDRRLSIIKSYMAQSQELRIKFSSKAASVSNAWKKWQGESLGIKRMNTVESKKAYEKAFSEWARGTPYEGVVESIDSLLIIQEPYDFAKSYYQEAVSQVEIAAFAAKFDGGKAAKMSPEEYKKTVESFFGSWYKPLDKDCFVSTMQLFSDNVPEDFKPEYFKQQMSKFGTVEAWAEDIFEASVFANKDALLALEPQAAAEAAKTDPAATYVREMARWYAKSIHPVWNSCEKQVKILMRKYVRGKMEKDPDARFYPDANLTLRVAYGHVKGYSPSDGIYYYPVSTLKGVIEKDNPEIFDYDIPQSLRDMYEESVKADPAGVGIGNTPVCILADNHTSGGNSGSPVIDADGRLAGINFDRVWEGTMSDIVFDPDYCRNISIDIRYLLFVVDKIGNASTLLDEMTIVY